MAFTYSKLAEVTVGSGGAATIDFTNIPQNYTDLVLKSSARSATGDSDSSHVMFLSFNGSTSNRTSRNIYAYGTTVASDSTSTINAGSLNGASGTASTFNNIEIYIPNYAGSANKSLSIDRVNESNTASGNSLALSASLWSSTTAISQITLTPDAGNFAQYTTATLYGIRIEL